jgi:acyl-CoA synthetase (AMP-forming)/AMP-acid ligase II
VEQPLVISDFLDRAELVFPARIAIIDEPAQPAKPFGPELSYAQLAERARGQAAFLDDLGVDVGARVAIVSHNSSRMLCSYFGVSGSGRVLVPINFRLADEEVAFIVEHSGSELVLLDPELEHLAASLGDVTTHVLGEDDDLIFPQGRSPRPWDGDERATATINYTSGTTASPKGVELSHRNLWLNATVFGMHLGVSDRDVLLHTLPIFHVNGWGMPFIVSAMGGTHVILRKVDGAEILRRIEANGVTLLCGAPAVLSAVLDAAADWEGPIPGHGTVRVVVAGAPPPTVVIERIELELGWEFAQIYGLTETSPVLTVNRSRAEWDWLSPHERARRLARAGAPVLGTKLTLSEDHEVLARSNAIMSSYWRNEEATTEAFEGDWFHTGDGGEIDDKGYLAITDRKKDVIITGGENVSSIEVEDILLRHPSVKEAAVIGIPHTKWGELVTALIVSSDPEIDLGELTAMAREHLAGYKIPRRIELRDELARTATGKLQKAKLRAPYWEGLDRGVN